MKIFYILLSILVLSLFTESNANSCRLRCRVGGLWQCSNGANTRKCRDDCESNDPTKGVKYCRVR